MTISEKRLEFCFPDHYTVLKFDDRPFYKKCYNHVQGGKGVDIVACDKDNYHIIEVKDCSQSASGEDKWRRAYHGSENMNTLATEIALKVAHTCACLCGAATHGKRNKDALEYLDAALGLQDQRIAETKKKLYVLLYLEGDFSCQTRSNKMILGQIREKIKPQLKWLNCTVDVVSTALHHSRDFTVSLTKPKSL